MINTRTSFRIFKKLTEKLFKAWDDSTHFPFIKQKRNGILRSTPIINSWWVRGNRTDKFPVSALIENLKTIWTYKPLSFLTRLRTTWHMIEPIFSTKIHWGTADDNYFIQHWYKPFSFKVGKEWIEKDIGDFLERTLTAEKFIWQSKYKNIQTKYFMLSEYPFIRGEISKTEYEKALSNWSDLIVKKRYGGTNA